MQRRTTYLLATSTLMLSAAATNAATVSWTAPASTTSNNDIVNPGSIISAHNFGANGDIDVNVGGNTVTFVQTTLGFAAIGDGGKFNNTGTTVGADFDSVLNSFAFQNGAGSRTMTVSGLTGGNTYNVQAFASDENATWVGYSLTIDGVSSAPLAIVGGADPNGTSFSPFVTGTVTLGAGETSFDIQISSTNTSVINALVVSAVPEPTSLALLGLGGLCVLRRRRYD